MTIHRTKLLLTLLAALVVGTSRLPAATGPTPSDFFTPESYVGDGGNGYSIYYLDYFNYYTYSGTTPTYVYKFNFGFLYFFGPSGGTTSSDEAYFYDFTSKDYFYTAASLYPYFYSFGRQTFLYYFEGSNPREFYDFNAKAFVYF